MVAYDEHQCTINFRFSEEINCNNNCISHIIPSAIMSEITLNITLHDSTIIDYKDILFHNHCL